MPYYNYLCLDCQQAAEAVKGAPLTAEELPEVLFETKHAMSPTPAELQAAGECPRCGGHNTKINLQDNQIHTYVRGYGYLDRAGCHRDMNLYKLAQEDPYASMREPGEADDLAHRLRRAGKVDRDTKHYVSPTSTADLNAACEQVAKNSGPAGQ